MSALLLLEDGISHLSLEDSSGLLHLETTVQLARIAVSTRGRIDAKVSTGGNIAAVPATLGAITLDAGN